MSPLAMFLWFKGALALGAIAFAVREIIVAGRPDSNPEFTAKLLRTFTAAERRRRPAAAPLPPAADPAPAPAGEPANDPEARRRAA